MPREDGARQFRIHEQFVTVENSMGVVQKSIGSRPPASNNLRSEVSIVSGIAMAIEEKIDFQKLSGKSLPQIMI